MYIPLPWHKGSDTNATNLRRKDAQKVEKRNPFRL